MTTNKPMTLEQVRGQLIKLGAEMAQRKGMPSIDGWRWPARVPKALARDARFAEDNADRQCVDWAAEIKKLADSLANIDAHLSASKEAVGEICKKFECHYSVVELYSEDIPP